MDEQKYLIFVNCNPHDFAVELQKEESPFYDPIGNASVWHHIIENNVPVAGIVDVWGPNPLSPLHHAFLMNHPNVIRYRPMLPEEQN